MPPIPQIVKALRTSRAAFGAVFEQAQLGLPPNRRVLFDAFAVFPTDAENFTKALEHARDNGYLAGLLAWLIDQNLEDCTLALAVADALPQPEPGGDTVQSIVSEVRGFTQPDALYRGAGWDAPERKNCRSNKAGVCEIRISFFVLSSHNTKISRSPPVALPR